MHRVAMLVRNDVRHDARVQREATALSSRYHVTVFGVDAGTPYPGGNGFAVRLLRRPARTRSGRSTQLLLAYPQFAVGAIAALVRHQPDVLHAHDLDALLPCAIVAARLGVPLIYDAHELYAEQGRHGRLGQRFLRRIEDLAMCRAAAIFAANRTRADVMWREYRVPVQPVVIVNCPPANRGGAIVTDGRLRQWIAEQGRRWDRLVVYAGSFLADRHLSELAGAAHLLPPNVGTIFVGSGPAADAIRRAGADRVLVHPMVPLTELLPFIAGADVGVVTYANTCRNNYLCAPNKLFDYAGAGVPIAAGDLPELVRMVDDFGAGVIFKNGDPLSMASAITALLSDEARLHRASDGARRLALRFTWEDEARKLLGIYEQVINRRPPVTHSH